ncbi:MULTISPECIES: TRAP transporter small permease [Ramlibacter]|jgi:TRAP-type C4-dicarboxylate transport system permease small subunit|uniref:TRAP transporter small permease protein n=1 Tax=Ramlibacter pinisoli TaxID=2682844 RepID=A0A6N8IVI9_9BURK|nr:MULTISPECIES: TRAP transporter small permease [Ramlibacter]MBA2961019.1 TRAP transporter small permease [Ramlibacter sp. CGMCC 1.13660]MVQ30964.1 TRAP transporter small permease subunit [Ramlibacter pinisoli]
MQTVQTLAPPSGGQEEAVPAAGASRAGRLLSLRRIDEAIGVACMLAIVASIAWGVITRYLFPQPAAWTFEAAVIAFGWLVFFGSAACVRWRMHADVDALVAMFPPKVRRVVFIGNWLLLAVLFVVLAAMFAWQGVIAHSIRVVSLDIPRSVVYAPMSVASILMLVQHLLLAPWRDGWQWRASSESAL